MLTLAIIISVLVLLALLRYGIIVEYSDAGFELWVKIGFIKLRMLDENKKKKPKKKKKKESKVKRPGDLGAFIDMLRAVKNALGRLKRRLLIKRLTLHVTSASNDPAKTAILFGAANAVFGVIVPALEKNFRIRRRDLRAAADFNSEQPGVYAKIAVSIATWEAIYIVIALFPIITAIFGSRSKSKTKGRKDGQNNGETTDKRLDGDHDAENKGDD